MRALRRWAGGETEFGEMRYIVVTRWDVGSGGGGAREILQLRDDWGALAGFWFNGDEESARLHFPPDRT